MEIESIVSPKLQDAVKDTTNRISMSFTRAILNNMQYSCGDTNSSSFNPV
jgi:hypothetical protein